MSLTAALNGTDGFVSVPLYARRPFDTPTSFAARNLALRDTWHISEGLEGNLRFDYHKNNQQLGTPLSTNHQDTWSYAADLKKSYDPGSSLAATVFYADSRFVTNNPTVTDSTQPLASQAEHRDNVHTTPFHDYGGSLVWSQDLPVLVRSVTAGIDLNDVKGYDSAARNCSSAPSRRPPSCRWNVWSSSRAAGCSISKSSTAMTATRAAQAGSPIKAPPSSTRVSACAIRLAADSHCGAPTIKPFVRRPSTTCIAGSHRTAASIIQTRR